MIDVFLMVLSVDVEMAIKQASRGTACREKSNARSRATQDSHPFSPNRVSKDSSNGRIQRFGVVSDRGCWISGSLPDSHISTWHSKWRCQREAAKIANIQTNTSFRPPAAQSELPQIRHLLPHFGRGSGILDFGDALMQFAARFKARTAIWRSELKSRFPSDGGTAFQGRTIFDRQDRTMHVHDLAAPEVT